MIDTYQPGRVVRVAPTSITINGDTMMMILLRTIGMISALILLKDIGSTQRQDVSTAVPPTKPMN